MLQEHFSKHGKVVRVIVPESATTGHINLEELESIYPAISILFLKRKELFELRELLETGLDTGSLPSTELIITDYTGRGKVLEENSIIRVEEASKQILKKQLPHLKRIRDAKTLLLTYSILIIDLDPFIYIIPYFMPEDIAQELLGKFNIIIFVSPEEIFKKQGLLEEIVNDVLVNAHRIMKGEKILGIPASHNSLAMFVPVQPARLSLIQPYV